MTKYNEFFICQQCLNLCPEIERENNTELCINCYEERTINV